MKGQLIAVLVICIVLNVYVKHLLAVAHKNQISALSAQTKKS